MKENKVVDDNTEKLETKKETYLNRETLEVLTDSFEISYYKNLQFQDIVDNQLLGKFDSSGNYVISKEILLELVAVKKYIKESKDNKHIIKAPIKEGLGSLTFTLKIENDSDFKKVATLKLIETILKQNEDKEFLKTTIARYKDDDDIYFNTKVKKVFNIVDTESEERKIDNEEFLKIILKKFKDFELLNKQNDKIDSLAKEYIEKVLLILKNNPSKYSEYILRNYVLFLNEMKGLVDSPKYYKMLQLKLDRIIDKTNLKLKDPIINNLITSARKEFLEKYKAIKEEVLTPKVVKPQVKEVIKTKRTGAKSSVKKGAKKTSAPKTAGTQKKEKKKKINHYPPFKQGVEQKKSIEPKIEKDISSNKDKVAETIDLSQLLSLQKEMTEYMDKRPILVNQKEMTEYIDKRPILESQNERSQSLEASELVK